MDYEKLSKEELISLLKKKIGVGQKTNRKRQVKKKTRITMDTKFLPVSIEEAKMFDKFYSFIKSNANKYQKKLTWLIGLYNNRFNTTLDNKTFNYQVKEFKDFLEARVYSYRIDLKFQSARWVSENQKLKEWYEDNEGFSYCENCPTCQREYGLTRLCNRLQMKAEFIRSKNIIQKKIVKLLGEINSTLYILKKATGVKKHAENIGVLNNLKKYCFNLSKQYEKVFENLLNKTIAICYSYK